MICSYALALVSLNQPIATASVTWQDVVNQIDAHAVAIEGFAELDLFLESHAGFQTWVLFSGSSISSPAGTQIAARMSTGSRLSRLVRLSPSAESKTPVENGVGWPSSGDVIYMDSSQSAAYLASLVQAVTVGGDNANFFLSGSELISTGRSFSNLAIGGHYKL
jgi:hypothetical protein